MEKVSTQRSMRNKKTRNTNKVSKVQNVEKPVKRRVGRPKGSRNKVRPVNQAWPEGLMFPPQRYTQVEKDKIAKKEVELPYMKVIYTSGNYTEEVEFSPDKPLSGTSYTTQTEKDQNRALWFVLGVLVGGFAMWGLWKLVMLGVL